VSYREDLKRLREMRRRIGDLERDFEAEVRRVFSAGSEVDFQKGRGEVNAEVLDVGYGGDRLKVRNYRTGKEYWVGIHFILNSAELPIRKEAGR
jgi:hypothetical protein